MERPKPSDIQKIERLCIETFASRLDMGKAAAWDVAQQMHACVTRQPYVRMVFAAAPSQNELLAALAAWPDLPWDRVLAFHMDEYVGLDGSAPQGFGNFLRERLFDLVHPGQVSYLDGNTPDLAGECARYAHLLSEKPIDIICAGIGENGHMAFNDPHVADFRDPETVKIVTLDQICREQQVHDGAFDRLDQVPTLALTMTMPAIMSAERVYCIVPGPTKQEAVARTLRSPVGEACPATIMRQHSSAVLYIDYDAAAGLT